MIKKSSLRRIMIATLALVILLIIYFFPNTENYNSNLSYIDQEQIPIFLIDEKDYVARTTIIKSNEELNKKIKDIIEVLTINSNKSSYIRDGFKPIIPENTKVLEANLDNNILTINFSKELLNVSKTNEENMIEALIYSLLEIKEIKKISILVEGTPLTNLPNSHKKIPEFLDRSYGINKIYNFDSIKDTTKTTIYYISKNNDYYYYVPVTKISNNNTERVEIIINELKTTPIYHTNLISYLAASASLSNYELLEDSINLSFNNYLLSNLKDNDILEEVKYSIALSLRDTYDISEVVFEIPNTKTNSTKF